MVINAHDYIAITDASILLVQHNYRDVTFAARLNGLIHPIYDIVSKQLTVLDLNTKRILTSTISSATANSSRDWYAAPTVF